MTEAEYRNREVALRLADLAVQEAIMQNLQQLVAKQGGIAAQPDWDRVKHLYANGKGVAAKLLG
jgi:hypothetical protein